MSNVRSSCFLLTTKNANIALFFVSQTLGVLWSLFGGYVPLASENIYPIIVYSVANYRPHLVPFCTTTTLPPPPLVLKSSGHLLDC